MILTRLIILCSALIVLSGCSSLFGKEGVFRGKSEDYLGAGSIKEIEVPEDMDSKKLEQIYAIPDSVATDEFGDSISLQDFEVPRPISMKSEKGEVGVKIQKVGSRKWIFLNAPASQIWPRTQNYFSQKRIKVARTKLDSGLIETTTFANESGGGFSRLRIYVEKGIHPETTEIHILQASAQGDEASSTWPSQSDSQEIELAILKELAEVLAVDLNNKSASLLGQNVGGEPKAGFVKGAFEPTLYMKLERSRAAAVLKRSMETSGFILWDELTTSNPGVFYVDYVPESEESGFWMRAIGLGHSANKKPGIALAEALARLDSAADVKALFTGVPGVAYGEKHKKQKGYLLVLSPADQGFQIVIRDSRGAKIPRNDAKEMLALLRKNLI